MGRIGDQERRDQGVVVQRPKAVSLTLANGDVHLIQDVFKIDVYNYTLESAGIYIKAVRIVKGSHRTRFQEPQWFQDVVRVSIGRVR